MMGLEYGDSRGVGEKWSDPDCILKVEPMRFLMHWRPGVTDRERLMFQVSVTERIVMTFTERGNICGGTGVERREIKGSIWNMLGLRCLLDVQEEIQNRPMTMEVREKVQTRLQHFRNHEHAVCKAIGLDEVTLGMSLDSKEESSKPWTLEHLEVMKSHEKGLRRSSQ